MAKAKSHKFGSKEWYKDQIRQMLKYREFELQQKYKDFEEDAEWKIYKKILGE